MSKLTDESVYCEYDRDLNHKFMACEKCQHNMKIEATKTQPTNSIDSELEEIFEDLEYSITNARGEDWYEMKERAYAEALQAIKALYISRKEVEEAIDHKLKVLTVQNIEPFPNGQYINVKELRAKLLPPTKGSNDEV